ncbi:hypothetical protein FAI41_03250 [Acetobacteraceae bacterium]|nr:hypothetical protein FAI41_03250 [Acetobacteraceae bacterium]
MSDQSKIENEVAELKELLSNAENRLKQLELEQAQLKAHGGNGLLKHLKKALIIAGVLLIAVKGGKVISRRRKHKKDILSPELNAELGLLLEEGKKKLNKTLR